jgi:hypothetical protein
MFSLLVALARIAMEAPFAFARSPIKLTARLKLIFVDRRFFTIIAEKLVGQRTPSWVKLVAK